MPYTNNYNQYSTGGVRLSDKKIVKLTESGADALVEGSISTNADKERGKGLLITKIKCNFTQGMINFDPATVTHGEITLQVNAKTSAALLALDDKDQVAQISVVHLGKTSGAVDLHLPLVISESMLFFGDKVYFILDSASTGLTLEAFLTIYCREVTVTDAKMQRRAYY